MDKFLDVVDYYHNLKISNSTSSLFKSQLLVLSFIYLFYNLILLRVINDYLIKFFTYIYDHFQNQVIHFMFFLDFICFDLVINTLLVLPYENIKLLIQSSVNYIRIIDILYIKIVKGDIMSLFNGFLTGTCFYTLQWLSCFLYKNYITKNLDIYNKNTNYIKWFLNQIINYTIMGFLSLSISYPLKIIYTTQILNENKYRGFNLNAYGFFVGGHILLKISHFIIDEIFGEISSVNLSLINLFKVIISEVFKCTTLLHLELISNLMIISSIRGTQFDSLFFSKFYNNISEGVWLIIIQRLKFIISELYDTQYLSYDVNNLITSYRDFVNFSLTD